MKKERKEMASSGALVTVVACPGVYELSEVDATLLTEEFEVDYFINRVRGSCSTSYFRRHASCR